MKKTITILLAAVFLVALGLTVATAAGRRTQHTADIGSCPNRTDTTMCENNYVDADNDGTCDNKTNNENCGNCANNNNGVCENKNAVCANNYVDADNDGTCDNKTENTHCGTGNRRQNGKHHGQNHS